MSHFRTKRFFGIEDAGARDEANSIMGDLRMPRLELNARRAVRIIASEHSRRSIDPLPAKPSMPGVNQPCGALFVFDSFSNSKQQLLKMPGEKAFTGRFGSDLRHYRSDARLAISIELADSRGRSEKGGCRGHEAAQFTQ